MLELEQPSDRAAESTCNYVADPIRSSKPSRKEVTADIAPSDGPVILIDSRRLLSQCLLISLRAFDSTTIYSCYSSLDEWLDAGSELTASLLMLCFPSGQSFEAEISELRRALSQLNDVSLGTPVAVMSDRESPEQIMAALELGIRGYLPTSTSLEVALHALQLVRAGGVYVPASILSILAPSSIAKAGSEEKGSELFSPRQLRVARALRKGTPNKLIAYELDMCESTVKVHVRNIMKKLKARNRTEVAYLTNQLFAQEESELASRPVEIVL